MIRRGSLMKIRQAMTINFIDVVVNMYRRGCSIPAIADKLHCNVYEVANICHEVQKLGYRYDIYQLYESIYKAGMKKHMKKINGKEYVEKRPHNYEELREIISILRSPEGCPWDREQTPESLKKCLTDEVEEVLFAIDNADHENLCEELGDVLLQLLLIAEIAKEREWFSFEDVIQGISDKMIRRHPHVFGDLEGIETADDTLDLWKKVKETEKKGKSES